MNNNEKYRREAEGIFWPKVTGDIANGAGEGKGGCGKQAAVMVGLLLTLMLLALGIF